MSRSNPTPTNPAGRTFEWSSSQKRLQYYDRETKETIGVPFPFEFMVLDELATIAGFCKPDSSSYWSNEVRRTGEDELTVRTSRGIKEVGLYRDLDVRKWGAKFAKSIYIAYKDENGNYTIGRFKAYGSALGVWMDLAKRYVLDNGKVVLVGSQEATNGSTTYNMPVFKWDHSTAEEDTIAKDLDERLQIFLKYYLAAAKIDNAENNVWPSDSIDEVGKATPEQIEDFEQRKAEQIAQKEAKGDGELPPPAKPDVVIDDLDDEPINLDEIPF